MIIDLNIIFETLPINLIRESNACQKLMCLYEHSNYKTDMLSKKHWFWE